MITDYRKMPQKATAYPAAGSWFADPAFANPIFRVTDERDGKRCTNAYSYWPALNCDSTWLLIACDDVPRLVRWSPTGGRVDPAGSAYPLCGEGDPPLQFEGATWSSTEPNVMKALGRDGVLYRYNVSLTPGKRARKITTLGEGAHHLTASKGGTVFAFLTPNEAFVITDKGDSWAYSPPLTTDKVNEIQMCRNGIRAVVHLEPRKGEREGRAFLWDFRRDLQVELPNATSHWDNGSEVMVNGDGQQTGIQARTYNKVINGKFVPVTPENLMLYWKSEEAGYNWNIADHVSLSNDEKTVLVSTYGKTVGEPFEHEIFLVSLTGNPIFQRICGTHSKYFERSSATKALRYYDEPHAVLSMDGRWAIWSSNLSNDKRWDVLATRIDL